MKSQLLVLDDLDSRRELHTLLAKLPPQDRIRFLRWCCSRCPTGQGRAPVPMVGMMKTTVSQAEHDDEGDRRFTYEVYGDLLQLFANFKLDAVQTARELEQWVRYPEYRRAVSRSLSRHSASPAAATHTVGNCRATRPALSDSD